MAESAPRDDVKPANSMHALLQASNIAFAYGDHVVLRDVSLSLDAGELVALLGPNGSGKSTLIRALLGQLSAGGEILWDGKRVSSINRRELARRVAYLPQSPTFEPQQNVLDILRLGRSPYWSAFGIESARDAQVIEDTAQMLGLNDLLHRRMDELSGGQRQRVFVGRCLVQQPAAMLLDEPSTFLDLRYQVELCNLLRRLTRGDKPLAVLMASHDVNLAASFSDRLLLLSQGVIAASGPASSVLQPELLSQAYQVRLERIPRPGKPPIILPAIEAMGGGSM
jgi:ABC-type cobalamin/Fe3+-siderophores transport system ATPase subunit